MLLKHCTVLKTITAEQVEELAAHLPEPDGTNGAFILPPELRKLCVVINACETQVRRLRKICTYVMRRGRRIYAKIKCQLHEEMQNRARLGAILLAELAARLKLQIPKDQQLVLRIDRSWAARLLNPPPEGNLGYVWMKSGLVPVGIRPRFVSTVPGAATSRNCSRVVGRRL